MSRSLRGSPRTRDPPAGCFAQPLCRCRRRERARHLLLAITLDDVADLDVVEVLDADAALESFAHFLDVVLEPPERPDVAVVDLDSIANHACSALPVYHSASHSAACDKSDPRNLERLSNFGFAEYDFALLGLEHSFEGGAHFFDGLVDDLVELDVDPFALSGSPRIVVRPDVEADDDRAGCPREKNISLVDGSDAAVNHID